MRYHALIEILQKKYKLEPHLNGANLPIMDIRKLDNNESRWNKHILYVGSAARLDSLPDRPIMMLSVDQPPQLPEGSSYALIKPADLTELYNEAENLIFEDLQGDSVFIELAEISLNTTNIKHLMNTTATLLGNALILVDASQKVLAHSTNYEIADPHWAENIERGCYSYEFTQLVRSNRDMQEWSKQGHNTRLITLPGDKQPKLVARITQEKHVLGAAIMIAEHTPIGRNHLRLLPLIGRLIFDVLNRDANSRRIQRSFYGDILYNLLDDTDILNTLEYIAMSKADFPAKMRVIVARFIHRNKNRYLKYSFSMLLERIFPRGHSVRYKGYMGILVPSLSEKQRKQLAVLAQDEDVTIGISWPFTGIAEFKRHFDQAVTSIKLSHYFKQDNRVLNYSDFYFYDLLYNYVGKTPLGQYCHPALQILHEYDRTNNTELYKTLHTYLECNRNQSAAAEALFIHRNSLIYRLNRILQLTGLDLDDINVVYSLMDSMRIETFLNSIAAEVTPVHQNKASSRQDRDRKKVSSHHSPRHNLLKTVYHLKKYEER